MRVTGMWPVAEIVDQFEPAYGDSWEDMIAELLECPHERKIVLELQAALERDGQFRDPIRIDYDVRRVGNGMHRMCAALLADLPVIWVTTDDVPEPAEYVEITFSIDSPLSSDEEFFEVVSGLRSFPLDDNVWVEAWGQSCNHGRYCHDYHCPPERAGELVQMIRGRLQALELTPVGLRVRRAVWED